MTQSSIVFKDLLPLLGLLALGATAGCSKEASSERDPPEVADEVEPEPPGIHRTADEVIFRTEQFTVDPGDEKFVCYTQTLEEDLVVGGYAQPSKPFLHHVVFAKTTGDEPEGASECDVLFRFVWEPIYLAGTGEGNLDFPEGVGQVLPAGTRLLSQLHLLNASGEPVTDAAEIRMRPSPITDPRPMGTFAMGNFDVFLPPLQTSQVESVCTISAPTSIVAAFPHMHYLGTSLTFEVGPSADQLVKVYESNPYSFDNQKLELLDLTLNPGDVTRVTCNYDNPHNETITFGESTMNEMCFMVGFVADTQGYGGCVTGDVSVLQGL